MITKIQISGIINISSEYHYAKCKIIVIFAILRGAAKHLR